MRPWLSSVGPRHYHGGIVHHRRGSEHRPSSHFLCVLINCYSAVSCSSEEMLLAGDPTVVYMLNVCLQQRFFPRPQKNGVPVIISCGFTAARFSIGTRTVTPSIYDVAIQSTSKNVLTNALVRLSVKKKFPFGRFQSTMLNEFCFFFTIF